MAAIWSDSGSSESKSQNEEIVDLCRMARENARESDECEEVALEYLCTFTN